MVHWMYLLITRALALQGLFWKRPWTRGTKVIDINVKGVVHGCHYFLPDMVAAGKGGSVVNLASMAAFIAPRDMSIYATSKFAVLGFSESLRNDIAEHNIHVATICPGVINTLIVKNTVMEGTSGQGDLRDKAVAIYQRRNYSPQKVAQAVISAVSKQKSTVPVSPEAWLSYYAKRWVPIKGRNVQFDFTNTDPYWLKDDPFSSYFVIGFHIMLPPGERFFCRLFVQALPLITDEALREDVKGFIRQEAIHSRQHTHAQTYLERNGYKYQDVLAKYDWLFEEMLGDAPFGMRYLNNRYTNDFWVTARVGFSAAIEHFTSVAGRWAMDNETWEKVVMQLSLISLSGTPQKKLSIAPSLLTYSSIFAPQSWVSMLVAKR